MEALIQGKRRLDCDIPWLFSQECGDDSRKIIKPWAGTPWLY
ncbi:hypothetical protein [Butyrivibrio sp. WCD3002]|nr:hypothetical protein [Butyrivibrio sp. WCD3002]